MLGTEPAVSRPDLANNLSRIRNSDVIDAISACAAQGQEAVLSATTDPNCVPYGDGNPDLLSHSPQMPYQVNALQACSDQTDKRVLDAHAIKIIAADTSKKVGPVGIRIVGAIFCDALDLVGLSLLIR
jgi:hypothetical protein